MVPQRRQGRPARRYTLRPERPESSAADINRRAARTAAASRLSETSFTRTHGDTSTSQSASAIHMLPMPATTR